MERDNLMSTKLAKNLRNQSEIETLGPYNNNAKFVSCYMANKRQKITKMSNHLHSLQFVKMLLLAIVYKT